MGARGPLPKPDAERQDHHTARSSEKRLTVLAGGKKRLIPQPPADLAPSSLLRWAEFWQSAVADAVDARSDLGRLYRWIEAVDELNLVGPIFRKVRLVKGSTGQTVLNPLAAYLGQLESVIAAAEAEFGMTPKSRARLGLTIGQAKLTAAELNLMLEGRNHGAGDDAALTADFEPG